MGLGVRSFWILLSLSLGPGRIPIMAEHMCIKGNHWTVNKQYITGSLAYYRSYLWQSSKNTKKQQYIIVHFVNAFWIASSLRIQRKYSLARVLLAWDPRICVHIYIYICILVHIYIYICVYLLHSWYVCPAVGLSVLTEGCKGILVLTLCDLFTSPK